MWKKVITLCFACGFVALRSAAGADEKSAPGKAGEVVYQNSFDQAELGSIPDDFLELGGSFAVQAEAKERFLELPGAPLDTFGLLFGPTEKEGIMVGARIFGTAKGRRYPTFAIGCNGYAGYRLQVSPGKKQLELFKNEAVQKSIPYEWSSGKWTHLRLHVLPAGPQAWEVRGKVWTEGAEEPKAWMIVWTEKEEPLPGRASIWGSPFATTPIRFDDLTIQRLSK